MSFNAKLNFYLLGFNAYVNHIMQLEFAYCLHAVRRLPFITNFSNIYMFCDDFVV